MFKEGKYLAETHKVEKIPREEWKFRLIFWCLKIHLFNSRWNPGLGVDFWNYRLTGPLEYNQINSAGFLSFQACS